MILLIDNDSSFTYNLYQYLGELGEHVLIKRSGAASIKEIELLNNLDAIVISPGSGLPEQSRMTMPIIQHFYKKLPILGIGLGHLAIAKSFGAKITKLAEIKHGKKSFIKHKGKGLFQYLPQPIEVMRYHSFAVDRFSLPPFFEALAISMDDGELMAMKHDAYPVYGLQFNPESIGTLEGKKIIDLFLKEVRKENHHERIIN